MIDFKKATLSGLALSAGVISLVGCAQQKTATPVTKNTKKTVQKKAKKDEYKNISHSSFIVTKDKKVVKEKDIPKNAVVIDWYLDPICPACNKLETLVAERQKDFYQDNQYYRYHVLSFLDYETQTKENKLGYSVRAAAYINGVAEVAPEKAVDYLNAIVNIEFRPENGTKSDKDFKEAFINLGGTESQWKQVEKLHKKLILENKHDTAKASGDKKLNARSNTGLFVPYILIGDSKALDFESDSDSVEYILNRIKTYKDDLAKEQEAQKAQDKIEVEKVENSSSSSTSTSSSSSTSKSSSSSSKEDEKTKKSSSEEKTSDKKQSTKKADTKTEAKH